MAVIQTAEFVLINQALVDLRVYKYAAGVNPRGVLIQSFLDLMEKIRAGRAIHEIYTRGMVSVLLSRLGIRFSGERVHKKDGRRNMDEAYLRDIDFLGGYTDVNNKPRLGYEWRPTKDTRCYCVLLNEFVLPTRRENIRFELPPSYLIKKAGVRETKRGNEGKRGERRTVNFNWTEEDTKACEELHYFFEEYGRELAACGPTPVFPNESRTLEAQYIYKTANL